MLFEEFCQKYRDSVISCAEQHHIENVRVFGSVATGETNENSDIDLLVSLGKGAGLLDLGGFQYDVQNLISESKIDVVPEDSIHWYIKDKILNEARPL